jgi:putative nucleotidyltransferase with HDIG domain
MNKNDVQQYIKKLDDLSTTPALLEKVLSLFEDDTKSIEDLINVISYDPAMAERVLKVANSTFFAHSGQINNIHQAVLFLGLERIKAIAVCMSILNIFPAHGSFHVENLWLHSYEVALLSSMLSESISITQPQECFLAGLLHDIGRIIFYTMDHKQFLTIETTDTMLEQELAIFECTHAEAGAWFAEEANLPASIVTTIKYHHLPSQAPDKMGIVSLVSLAEALSRMFSPRIEDDGIWTREHDALLLEFSLSQNDLRTIGERFTEAHGDIEKAFSQLGS